MNSPVSELVDPLAAEPFLPEGIEPVEPAYRHLLRVRFAIAWLVPVVGAVVIDQLLADTPFHGLLSTLVPLLAIAAVTIAPRRIQRRLGYRLTDRLLQVVRGWMFHVDTIVPLVRVQHIDVTHGPIEKLFGLATLVVHTAGTHNSVVTLPGLAPQRAEEIRDVIREHVRADL